MPPHASAFRYNEIAISAFPWNWRAMKNRCRNLKKRLVGIVALVFGATVFSSADCRSQSFDRHLLQDEALHAVQRGDIRPLAEIEKMARARIPGDILQIELERERETWVYEFKILDEKGGRYDLYIDARTGAFLRMKRK